MLVIVYCLIQAENKRSNKKDNLLGSWQECHEWHGDRANLKVTHHERHQERVDLTHDAAVPEECDQDRRIRGHGERRQTNKQHLDYHYEGCE